MIIYCVLVEGVEVPGGCGSWGRNWRRKQLRASWGENLSQCRLLGYTTFSQLPIFLLDGPCGWAKGTDDERDKKWKFFQRFRWRVVVCLKCCLFQLPFGGSLWWRRRRDPHGTSSPPTFHSHQLLLPPPGGGFSRVLHMNTRLTVILTWIVVKSGCASFLWLKVPKTCSSTSDHFCTENKKCAVFSGALQFLLLVLSPSFRDRSHIPRNGLLWIAVK